MFVLLFNTAVAIAGLLLLELQRRRERGRRFVVGGFLAHGLFAAGLAVAIGLYTPLGFFGCAALLSWLLFVHLPLLLMGTAVLHRRLHPRSALLAAGLTLALVVVAIDAFVIEPRWLEVTHYEIGSSHVDRPLRIVLLADLQTDRIGGYERRALAEAVAARPDVILMTGDYIQVGDNDSFVRLREELGRAMDEVGFDAPLGVFAVRGDIDADAWPTLFEGRGFHTVQSSSRFELPRLVVTALSPADSRLPHPPVETADRFHVVLGHDPRYALAGPPADLLVAGHTHGGQIRLPGFGPLLTLTTVPRRWAGGGLFELAGGGRLLVSRGVGMERNHAPRLRFLCRPELAIVDVVPAPGRRADRVAP